MSFPTVYYITQVIPSCYSAGYAMCVCVNFGACVYRSLDISAWVRCVCVSCCVYMTSRRLYSLLLADGVHKSANNDSTYVSIWPHIISMMESYTADTSTYMSASPAPIFNVVLSYTACGMSCAKINLYNGYKQLLSRYIEWCKICSLGWMWRTLRIKQQRQDSKNRSKKDVIITDILDALYNLDSRRMMSLFAIDPSGIGQIQKHNME